MTAAWVIHVVDNDEPVRAAFAFALEAMGYHVVTYADADDFLRHGRHQRGILVSDVRMPGMTGIELTRRLRHDGSTMPIFLMTGHADADLTADAMTAGAGLLLEKPVALTALLAEIAQVTANW